MPSLQREKIFGAKWWKFDFHSHTPASHDYGKGPDAQALKKISPRDWLLNVMSKKIDCIAVTDHNSGDWIGLLQEELKKLTDNPIAGFHPLVIFPGVEISVNGGIHLLAIFDPSESSGKINSVLGGCDFRGTRGETDDCTVKSFPEVVEIIHAHGGIAIPAHADKENGLFFIQGGPGQGPTLMKSLSLPGLLAIELCDRSFLKPQIYTEQLKMRLAEVFSSDSHRPDQVGRGFTWVKMERPTFAALKLALHDGADGVIRSDAGVDDPNETGNRFFITSLKVTEGAKAGRGTPLRIEFSPWLTSIIGGRGSGKSSILDYLRIVLGATNDMPEKVRADHEDFAQNTLGRGKRGMLTKNTEIRLELFVDGRELSITWNQGKWTEETKDENGNWLSKGDPGKVAERFPIRVFSQKQLYEMTQNPETLIHLIDSQIDKNSWNLKRELLEKKWLTSRSVYRDSVKTGDLTPHLRAQLDDINAKLKVFEESGNRETLESYQNIKKLESELNKLKVNEVCQKFELLIPSVPDRILSDSLKKELGSESSSIVESVVQEWSSIVNDLKSLFSRMKGFDEKLLLAIASTPWATEKDKVLAKYKELIDVLALAGEKNPQAYGDLVHRKEFIENQLIESEQLLQLQEKKEADVFAALAEITEHEKKLRELRSAVVFTWNKFCVDKGIRVSLEPLGNIENAELTLRALVRRTGQEFAKDILARDAIDDPSGGILFDLIRESPVNRWVSREQIVTKIALASESNPLGFEKRFAKYLEQLRLQTPEDIDRVISWFPEDRVVLQLVKDGKSEDIEVGSAGQRTAGMISLLLAIDNVPIIIDQPEDDLDTRLISELVVKGLRALKGRQQAIVVTHNPNIPVNGGAEQIVYMDFLAGQIVLRSAGALQRVELRNAICDVMEGGKDALENRYYRISQALEKAD